MGTKNDPGAYDCYSKAEPDEPIFTLLARDPMARHLVRMWGCLRRGDVNEAFMCWQRLRVLGEAVDQREGYADDKSSEAIACAWSMIDWYNKNILVKQPRPETGQHG